jgi:hypothetical protein
MYASSSGKLPASARARGLEETTMTTQRATFAGLALIALAIFAGHFTSPAGSQVETPILPQSYFMPMTPYGQSQGNESPSVWRMNVQDSRVSWCTSANVQTEPVCSPWSKSEAFR